MQCTKVLTPFLSTSLSCFSVFLLCCSRLLWYSTILLHTVNCTLYTLHCRHYTINCTLYTLHCKHYTMNSTMYTVQCTLHTVHTILYTVYCLLNTAHCILYTAHSTLYTVHFIMYTAHCTPYTGQCRLQNYRPNNTKRQYTIHTDASDFMFFLHPYHTAVFDLMFIANFCKTKVPECSQNAGFIYCSAH